MTKLKKVIDKIAKLMSLANSANPHEAAIALSRAQKLMREYELDETDIALASVGERAANFKSLNMSTYQARLVNLICKAFGCTSVFCPSYLGSKIKFIGLEPRPQLAAYCWDVLYPVLVKARAKHVKAQSNRCKRATKIARGDAYADAWVVGVSRNVKALAIDKETNELMVQYVKKSFNDLEDGKARDRTKNTKSNSLEDSRWAGFKDGKEQQIYSPVSGTETKKLGANL